jgi:hypothetical protein
MAAGGLQAGNGEVKVSGNVLASSQACNDDQRVFTAGGGMPGYQFVSRICLLPNKAGCVER